MVPTSCLTRTSIPGTKLDPEKVLPSFSAVYLDHNSETG